MPITKQFRKTILQRAESDVEFRRHMQIEAVNELIGGDLNAGKSILRDYINATITEIKTFWIYWNYPLN
jgi:hypothetical protein